MIGTRLAYDDRGQLKAESRGALEQVLREAQQASDVIVFSHGWWNSPASAECRYRQMIDGVSARIPETLRHSGFRAVLIGIYWPSALFPPDPGDCEAEGTLESRDAPLDENALRGRLDAWARAAFPAAALRPTFPVELTRLASLVHRERSGESLGSAEGEVIVATLVAWRDAGQPLDQPAAPVDGPGDPRFDESPNILTEHWTGGRNIPSAPRPTEAGERLGPMPSGRWIDWANVFTFWTMKDRAGVVGSHGVYEVLQRLQVHRARGLRIHLVAHSFGGKLLTAAITGHGQGPANTADSFVILQGAFSHFAFSTAEQIRALHVATELSGLYAEVVTRRHVTGPLVVTYSVFDTPNRVWYPLGARASGDMREASEVARYGSLGADGMRGPTVEAMNLATDRLSATLRAGPATLVNVDATEVIRGHSDFVKPQVFDLIWDAILAGRQQNT